jgi:UDP-N-acetylmuramate--alanine ligase
MDADHLDIYGDVSELKKSFIEFSDKIKSNGKLFVKNGLPIDGITYGIDDDSDYSVKNIKIENAMYVFDVVTPKTVLKNIQFNLPGRHNLSNALVALAMAVEYGCPPEQLAKALASYKGVKRRFSYHLKTENLVLIDDYAHHPEEINAVYQAVKEMYPGKNILVVFQPHLFSRTKDFADAFATSLQQFDQILLLDIYPAREIPIKGITSEWLLEKIKNPNKKLIVKEDLTTEIQKSNAAVVITMGAGDIGEEVKTIKHNLSFAS